MSSFEQYRPKLKPCLIRGEGSHLVIEENGTGRHYVLSAETQPILERLDGNHSVSQLVSELHERHEVFRFRTLVETLQKLQEAGFFEEDPSAHVIDPVTGEKRNVFARIHRQLTRFRISFLIRTDWETGFRSTPAFYFLAFALIGCGALSFATDAYFTPSNTFGSFHGSSLAGLAFLIGAASALLSMKAVLQAALQVFATGKVYSPSIRLARFTVHFGVSDAAIYLAKDRAYPVFFHLASLSSVFAIVGLAEPILRHHAGFNDIKSLALFLTLLDFSPYLQGEAFKVFQLFQGDDISRHLIPYLRKRSVLSPFAIRDRVRNELPLALYASFALAWSAGSLFFCLSLLQANLPNLWLQLESGSGLERSASLLELVGLGACTAYFLFDLAATLVQNLAHPFLRSLHASKSRISGKPGSGVGAGVERSRIREKLAENPLFHGLQETTLDFILELSWSKDYPKGTSLIVQGTQNEAVFALLEGSVAVVRRESSGAVTRVARLHSGSAVGESSVIQDTPATADVVADTPVRALVIHKSVIRQIARIEQGSTDHETLLARIMLGHFLSASPLFRNLPAEIIHLFTQKGTRLEVQAGEMITEQGSNDRSFHLVIHGKVEVWVDGAKVKELGQGEFFGEVALIADVARTATVGAAEDCALLRIDAAAFWDILSRNIQLSLFIETIADHRSRETQSFKTATCTKEVG